MSCSRRRVSCVIWMFALFALVLSACDVAGVADDVPRLDAQETADLLTADEDAVLIDVRTPDEVAAGALEGALAIDMRAEGFVDRVDALPRDATYVLYCRSGNRSAEAAQQMRELGFTDLYDAGAFEDLAAVGLATTP